MRYTGTGLISELNSSVKSSHRAVSTCQLKLPCIQAVLIMPVINFIIFTCQQLFSLDLQISSKSHMLYVTCQQICNRPVQRSRADSSPRCTWATTKYNHVELDICMSPSLWNSNQMLVVWCRHTSKQDVLVPKPDRICTILSCREGIADCMSVSTCEYCKQRL